MTTTLAEIVATVVVHSSAAALSHFGVTVSPPPAAGPAEHPAQAERVIARTPRRPDKIAVVPQAPRLHAMAVKA